MKEPRGCNARRVCQRAPRVSFAVRAGLGFKVGIGLAAFGFAYAYPVLNTQAADAAHAVVAVASTNAVGTDSVVTVEGSAERASERSDRNLSSPAASLGPTPTVTPPANPSPSETAPSGTAPAEPAPTTTTPTSSEPSTSDPRTPNPTQPGPTDPSATNPSPTHPSPTHPSPTAPSEGLTPTGEPLPGELPTASPSDSGQSSEREVASETSIDAPAHATTVDTQQSKIHGGPGMATPQGVKPAPVKRAPVMLREVPNETPPTSGTPTSTKMHVIYKVEKAPEPTLGTVNVEPVADVNETAKGIGTAVGGGIALFAIALWGLLRGRKI